MDPLSLKKLNACRRERQAALLLTDLDDGRDRVIRKGDMVAGALGEVVEQAFRSGRSGIAELEGNRFFLNVHLPPVRLVVIGAVHISQVLAPMARLAGLDITIIDPRTAFASPERFPDIALLAEWPQDALKKTPLDAYTALAALTHDPKIDDPALHAALEAGCFYVGALGGRKTHAQRVERLAADGMARDDIARIHAPIGLNIGAANPSEIAVSILAQVIATLRSRGLEQAKKEQAA